jgi:hypothetical protein
MQEKGQNGRDTAREEKYGDSDTDAHQPEAHLEDLRQGQWFH